MNNNNELKISALRPTIITTVISNPMFNDILCNKIPGKRSAIEMLLTNSQIKRNTMSANPYLLGTKTKKAKNRR